MTAVFLCMCTPVGVRGRHHGKWMGSASLPLKGDVPPPSVALAARKRAGEHRHQAAAGREQGRMAYPSARFWGGVLSRTTSASRPLRPHRACALHQQEASGQAGRHDRRQIGAEKYSCIGTRHGAVQLPVVLVRATTSGHARGTIMGSKTDKITGRLKEAVGVLTENDHLKREGQRDQVVGEVQEKRSGSRRRCRRRWCVQ